MLRLTPTNSQTVIQTNIFETCYSGGETNVACSLSMFGHETKLSTKLPTNDLGERAIRDLKSFGIDTTDIVRGEGRLGIYIVQPGHGMRNSEVIYDRKYSVMSLAKEDEFDIDKTLKNVKLLHMSGITPALGKELYNLTISFAKEAKKRGIVVSYDSNYRGKLWSLEQAREFTLEILPFVDIALLGILDFKNILKYEVNEKLGFEEQLSTLYNELFEKYPNIKYAASTKRTINTVNNNSLQGFVYNGKTLSKSKIYTFDILDRVGGGDAFTAGILHGLITNMDDNKIAEFATCASSLKHSIKGDINMVTTGHVITVMESGIENIKR